MPTATDALSAPVVVLGATGATGQHVVRQLLAAGRTVRAVVRSPAAMPADIAGNTKLQVVVAAIADMPDAEVSDLVRGCGAAVSCLGHNMTFRGMYLHPRRLCETAVKKITGAAAAERASAGGSAAPFRFILMNSVGCADQRADRPAGWIHWSLIGALRWVVPPVSDNEAALRALCSGIGTRPDAPVQWVAVRPDSLYDAKTVTPYAVVRSPLSDALLKPGKVSRINVADFMSRLVMDDSLFSKYRGEAPVIYDEQSAKTLMTAAQGPASGASRKS